MKIRNHILMALFLCVGVTLVMGQHPAFALIIFEYDFSGTVTNSNTPVFDLPEIEAGDTFIGHLALEYDPTLEDQVPSNNNRAVYDSYGSYSITFDNFAITSGGYSYLPVDLTLSTFKIYDFTPLTSDFWSDDLYFRFASSSGPVFDSYALPYGIDFNAFDEMTIWFQVYGPAGNYIGYEELVTSRIDSITQVPVPEPGTLLLLLSGLAIGSLVHRKSEIMSLLFGKDRTFN